MMERLLEESLQMKLTRARLERATTALQLARAERYPDVTLRAGYTYNNEPDESQVLFGIEVPLPIFDRNQGNIAQARAELERVRVEIRRLELLLRSQLASVFNIYRTSLHQIERLRKAILPRAEKAYQLYLKRFRQMTASYPQVLIARRSLFQARIAYVRSLVELRKNLARIEGLLLTGGLDEPGGITSSAQIDSGAAPDFKEGL